MAVQALYRKWRPQTFDQVIGQEHVVRTLRNALTSGRIHHAYLFAGPRGTGKTTTARLLAKAVNCLAAEEDRPCNTCAICQAVNERRLIDLIEIDAASNTGVDDVRELRERVGFRPNEARYKVYVVDEVHMLSNAAFNALLKTLEEPPPHAIFVLATTEPHKIPATVLSRCQRFDFHRIPISQIVSRLEWIVEQEQIKAEAEALALVARHATGSMRDAESLLDQLASYGGAGITTPVVQAALGTGTTESVLQVVDALAQGDVAQGLTLINTAVDEGADPRQFARQLVEHLRTLLLLHLRSEVLPPHISQDLLPRLKDQAAAFSPRSLARAVRLFNQAAAEAKGGWQPQLPLEMAFIEASLPPAEAEAPASNPSSPANPHRASPRRHAAPPSKAKPAASPSSAPPSSEKPAQAIHEAPPAYDAATEGPLTVEELQSRWPELLNALRPRNLSLEALMHSCEPVAIEDDTITLAFAHSFHRGKVEEDQNRHLIEDILAQLFGRRYRLSCVLAQENQPGETPHRPASPKSGSVEQIIADDPVVRTAVEDLGAQVVQGYE